MLTKHKIIHLTSVHGRYEIRTFLKECISLARYGYDVSIIIADGQGDAIKDGVKIYDAGPKTGGRLSRMTKTVRKIYKKAKELDGDVYHFHDPELIPVGLKLKKQGKKVIYDVHEDYGENIKNKKWLPKILRITVANIFDRYEKKAAKAFDGIVTATPHILNRFSHINPFSVDIKNYPIQKSFIPLSRKETYSASICFTGLICKSYGISELLVSLELLNNVNLILCGPFESQAYADELKLMDGWKFVDYRGIVDYDEVKRIFASCAIGMVALLPNTTNNYSLPIKMFEYMAAGLPVISSNFPLWKEIVEKNNCGICVNPLKVQEIAEAINWVLQNPADAAEMGRNGRKAVLEKYNWETESKKLIKFYEEILQ